GRDGAARPSHQGRNVAAGPLGGGTGTVTSIRPGARSGRRPGRARRCTAAGPYRCARASGRNRDSPPSPAWQDWSPEVGMKSDRGFLWLGVLAGVCTVAGLRARRRRGGTAAPAGSLGRPPTARPVERPVRTTGPDPVEPAPEEAGTAAAPRPAAADRFAAVARTVA